MSMRKGENSSKVNSYWMTTDIKLVSLNKRNLYNAINLNDYELSIIYQQCSNLKESDFMKTWTH